MPEVDMWPCEAADFVPHVKQGHNMPCQALCLRYTSRPVQSITLMLEACLMVELPICVLIQLII